MCHLKAEKNKSFWMFSEPDTISLFCLLMYMYFLFILLPHFVVITCSNPIMILFSVDGHHLAFLYDRTYKFIIVFCNQKQGSTKNVNADLSGNLYGAT